MKSVIFIATAVIFSMLAFQNCGKNFKVQDEPKMDYSSVLVSTAPDCEFNRLGLMEGQTVRAYQSSSVPAGTLCQFEERKCQRGQLLGSYLYGHCLPGAPKACLLDGKTISHGTQMTAYQSSQVAFGEECKTESRKCENGQISGSFSFSKCIVSQPIDCKLGNDTILNDSNKKYWKEAVVPFGQERLCQFEFRTCKNGVLSGTYTNTACNPSGPQSCTLDGKTVTSEQIWPFYDKQTVPFGQFCPTLSQAKNRKCINGVFDGDSNFKYSVCTVATAKDCEFNGQLVKHGSEPFKAYQVSVVPFGQTCDSRSQMRSCTDGKLDGTFTFATCSQTSGTACLTADSVTMQSGEVKLLKRKNLVISPDTCDGPTNTEQVTCTNGVLNGSARFANCQVAPIQILEPAVGGSGGGVFSTPLKCNTNASVIGVKGAGGTFVDRIGVLCSDGQHSYEAGFFAGSGFSHQCPGGKILAGLRGKDTGYVASVSSYCTKPDGSEGQLIGYSDIGYGTDYSHYCAPGWGILSITGRSGRHVDRLQATCVKLSEASGNINCQGSWQDRGCQNFQAGSTNLEVFVVTQPRLGQGAECEAANGATRNGTTSCYYDAP